MKLQAAVERWQPAYVLIHDSVPYPFFRPQEEERLAVLQRVLPGRLREVERHVGGRIYTVEPSATRSLANTDPAVRLEAGAAH